MVYKRFTYKNGLDIIVPLKCGTRWLEEKTNPLKIEKISTQIKIKGITKKTYWVYRNGKEHLLSALKTEIGGAFGYPNLSKVDSVVDNFLNNRGIHWSYNMFNYMYEHWSSVQFNILELKDLSNLFPDIEFNPSKYNMNYYQKITNDNSKVVEIIPIDGLNKLYELADKDEVYLKKILNKELNPIKII